MAGEEQARRIIEKELNRSVIINDDSSMPSMYDLRIGPKDAPELAIECVGAVDQIRTETWNIGPAQGPLQFAIVGDWFVTLAPTARIKALRSRLESLLREAEDRDLLNLNIDYSLERYDAELYEKFNSLDITHAYCYSLLGTGKVSLGMTGIGGAVDTQGSAVAKWAGEFLCAPVREDVLRKLQLSGALDRHVFIFVSFAGSPWSVESYMTGDLKVLPTEAPDLPLPVTGVWIISTFGRRGLRWEGDSWRLFDSRGEEIDD